MASLAFSPTQPKRLQTVTITGTAFSNTTAYNVVVSHQSIGTVTIPVVTNGSGQFTCTFVASGCGPTAVSVQTVSASTSTAASGSVSVNGD